MRVKCPTCGNVFSIKKVKHGDWIEDKEKYDAFWGDTPIAVKLAIEDYLFFKDKDWRKFTLQFTSEHNNADYPTVKKTLQDLIAGGMVYADF